MISVLFEPDPRGGNNPPVWIDFILDEVKYRFYAREGVATHRIPLSNPITFPGSNVLLFSYTTFKRRASRMRLLAGKRNDYPEETIRLFVAKALL